MKKLNINDYQDILEFSIAVKERYTKEELKKGILTKAKGLKPYFDIDNISYRGMTTIGKKSEHKTFASVRRKMTNYEVFKLAVECLSEALSSKFTHKYFKTYGITYPKEQINYNNRLF